ncbi:S24 family peptidase (plasmid) [Spirosoma sp. SC4-14]|uniref:LexA family protein n=1 Tax=Spirosoma sp. SC4-14 TaxID=3128900 RepID=UPI0030D1ECB7
MRAENGDKKHLVFQKATVVRRLLLPFFSSYVHAGTFSPATDHIEKVCDLNDLVIRNKDTTYFVRAIGDCMVDDGLWEGDIMIVDRSIEHYEGQIVVVWLDGEYIVRRYHKPDELVVLMPASKFHQPIYVQPSDNFKLFGVVSFWLKKAQVKKIFEL